MASLSAYIAWETAQPDKRVSMKCHWLEGHGESYIITDINGKDADLPPGPGGTKWATFLLSLRDLLERSHGHPIPHDRKIAVNG